MDDEVDLSRLPGQEQARAPKRAPERDTLRNRIGVNSEMLGESSSVLQDSSQGSQLLSEYLLKY